MPTDMTKRKASDRREKGEDRRKGTDPEIAKMLDEYGFVDERQSDRRSGRDRRDEA